MAEITIEEIKEMVQSAVNEAVINLMCLNQQNDDDSADKVKVGGIHMADVQGPLKRLFTQMVRSRQGAPGEVFFDIFLPGNVKKFVAQNGILVEIAAGAITQMGATEWYNLVEINGSTGTPVTEIWAMVIGSGTDHTWAVNPSGVTINFYTQAAGAYPPPTGGDFDRAKQYGLVWQVATVEKTRIVHQMALGQKIGTGVMGDFDTEDPAPYQSIKTIAPGVVQIQNWTEASVANDTSKPMLVNISGVATLMDQATGGGGAGTTTLGDADQPSPSQYSITQFYYDTATKTYYLMLYGWPGKGGAASSGDAVLVCRGSTLSYVGVDPL
jgi:hypothetical protein